QYEKELYDCLFVDTYNNKLNLEQQEKHIALVKATGLGASEEINRIIVNLATTDNNLSGTQMCIVTGPNIDLAMKLIARIKQIPYAKHGIEFLGSAISVQINNVEITAYPSNHLDAYRSLTGPSFIFLDEADFFGTQELQEDARKVTERYIGKSDPYIAIVSTPQNPDGFMWRIMHEKEQDCIYKRLTWHYTIGEGLIYDDEFIRKAKMSPSFRQEYCCEFLGLIGDLYAPESVTVAVNLGKYIGIPSPLETIFPQTIKAMGIDPAYGGSAKYGITVLEWLPSQLLKSVWNIELNAAGILRVVYNQGFSRETREFMLKEFRRIYYICRPRRIYCDDTAPEEIRSFKLAIGEDPKYERYVEGAKKNKLPLEIYARKMQVI